MPSPHTTIHEGAHWWVNITRLRDESRNGAPKQKGRVQVLHPPNKLKRGGSAVVSKAENHCPRWARAVP